MRTESRCRSNSCRRFRQPSRSAKTRSPTSRVHRAPDQIIQPAKTSLTVLRDCCCVSLQAQYQAFVRFAVESSTAPAIALDSTCVLEPFTRRALASRTLVSTRNPLRGQQTLDRCCGRNVVAPGQYSKWFFCVPIGLYRAILWPATALGMPARSAFRRPESANPAVVINHWIWPLWPSPASTTRVPPGVRRPAAWRISAR
jgi:hypothetical protein